MKYLLIAIALLALASCVQRLPDEEITVVRVDSDRSTWDLTLGTDTTHGGGSYPWLFQELPLGFEDSVKLWKTDRERGWARLSILLDGRVIFFYTVEADTDTARVLVP